MSYTVGVKRRFGLGYRRFSVTGHDWQNGRFILNLVDGCQEHIPGFSAPALKVYADFWTHLAQIERRPAAQPLNRQGASVMPPPPPEPIPVREEEPMPPLRVDSPQTLEIKRRAAEHVQRILDGAN